MIIVDLPYYSIKFSYGTVFRIRFTYANVDVGFKQGPIPVDRFSSTPASSSRQTRMYDLALAIYHDRAGLDSQCARGDNTDMSLPRRADGPHGLFPAGVIRPGTTAEVAPQQNRLATGGSTAKLRECRAPVRRLKSASQVVTPGH